MFSICNFGLYWGIPEGRNMLTIKDEEALYQNLQNLSWISGYILKRSTYGEIDFNLLKSNQIFNIDYTFPIDMTPNWI